MKTIRPISACSLHGIAFHAGYLLALDSTNGYLFKVDLKTNDTTILNPHCWRDYVGAHGLAIADNTLWFTAGDNIYHCSLDQLDRSPECFTRFPDPVDGVAIWQATIYVTCQRSGEIIVLSRKNGDEVTRFYAPGIGFENITVQGEQLWVCDDIEQTVFCLDRATGETLFSVLTPFESPTALAFHQPLHQSQINEPATLYVAYADREPYIRDNPNSEAEKELQYRDRTFVHPLYYFHDVANRYALSNGYLVEMSYVEELSPLDAVKLDNFEWHIAMPAETQRQRIRSIEPVGRPFQIREIDGQSVAVFKFEQLDSEQRYIFGWRAVLELWSIKYQLQPGDCDDLPPLPEDFGDRYLSDNDNLTMDSDIIQRAAAEATEGEVNLLRKMYSIRNYVYDHLSYSIKPHIDTPDIALKRGLGSCGEYLGVLLALARLNGIACRTIGRYKCPAQNQLFNVPLVPDFNHVWMEFFVPGLGWLPMESNADDVYEGGPYSTRFFMGLSWFHAEMAKGVPFSALYRDGVKIPKEEVAIGNLAINHVQFKILEELIPQAIATV